MIIDSHIHAVAADTVRYPLKPGPNRLGFAACQPSRSAPSWTRRKSAGPCWFRPFVRTDSTTPTPLTAPPHTGPFLSVCTVDPLARDAAECLSLWVTQRGAVGLRLHSTASGLPFNYPRIAALMRQAAKLNIAICVLTQFSGLVTLSDLLAQCPDVPVAIDHMGFPPSEEGALDLLFGLARFPNLFLKFSSLTLRATAHMETLLPRTIDHFGPHRLVWGFQFPGQRRRTVARAAGPRPRSS